MSIGNVMGANNPLSVTEARKTNDTSSLDSKIEQLKNR